MSAETVAPGTKDPINHVRKEDKLNQELWRSWPGFNGLNDSNIDQWQGHPAFGYTGYYSQPGDSQIVETDQTERQAQQITLKTCI